MASKKKKKGGAQNHMTSAERTRARMRAQEQARAAERERARAEEAQAARDAKAAEEATAAEGSARREVDDIDAQIAELERRKAELQGTGEAGEHAAKPASGATDGAPGQAGAKGGSSRPKRKAARPKAGKADKDDRGDARRKAEAQARAGVEEDRRSRPQAYPGEEKLRRAQRKLEDKAAVWDSNPTVNRIVCAVIDLFAGGVLLMGPVALTYYYMSGANTMTSISDFLTLGCPMALPVSLSVLGLVLGFFYYVIVPWKIWPGQTLGKHLGHIRIVRRDRRDLDFGTLFLRQFVGVMLLELWLTADCLLLPQLITLVTGSADAGTMFQSTGLAITVLSIVMYSVSQKRLALHDRFAGTRVE